jgi:hypothetical protein
MRKILTGCMMLLFTVAIGSAQPFAVTFTLKTPFSVASSTLPPGTYEIRLLDDSENVFECTDKASGHSVMFEADPHELTPTATEVTFAKYGDKLVLKNISVKGVAGYWIPLSVPEKHSKKSGTQSTKVSTPATQK